MSNQRQEMIHGIQHILDRNSTVYDYSQMAVLASKILDVGMQLTQEVKPGFSDNDFEEMIVKLSANSDTYVRKTVSGVAFAFVMGTLDFPTDVAGTLTVNYIDKVYGPNNSDEKVSIITMMGEMYSIAQQRSPFK